MYVEGGSMATQEEMNEVLLKVAGFKVKEQEYRTPYKIIIHKCMWIFPDNSVHHEIYLPNFFDTHTGMGDLFKWVWPALIQHYKKETESYLPEHYSFSARQLVLDRWLDDIEDGKDPTTALATACYNAFMGDKE